MATIKKLVIGTTTLNVYQIVAYRVSTFGDSLIVYTGAENFYFNVPVDIPDAQAAFALVDAAFDAVIASENTGSDNSGTGGDDAPTSGSGDEPEDTTP